MTAVRINHLNVTLSGKKVLQDICLEFHTDERILILGPGGCGKSTLLLSIMGIIQRMENADVTGEVFLGDRPVTDLKAFETAKILGIVFQSPESQFCTLYPENEVAFGLENLGVDPPKMDEMISNSLCRVRFPKERIHAQINELSGGEQQRLACAAAIAQGARMLLLDEPTSNLDPEGRRQVVDAADTLSRDGKGLLVVEHNLENWLPLTERVIILGRDGILLADGEPRDVLIRFRDEMTRQGIWRPRPLYLYDELLRSGCTPARVPLTAKELCEEQIPKKELVKAWERAFPASPGLEETPVRSSGKDSVRESIVKADNLSEEYQKGSPVFRDISFWINRGDFVALVGKNGSGKSTLAKTLVGLHKASKGTIQLFGEDTTGKNAGDIFGGGDVGYVFQNPEHQFLKVTVWDELEYSVRGTDTAQAVRRLIREFGLEGLESSNPFSLSGGQKRRLSVAVMLCEKRKFLILDEPTYGQDEKTTYALMEKLDQYHRQGTSILMITHDLDLAAGYADEAAVLSEGKLAFYGDPKELWKRPDLVENSGLELPLAAKLGLEGEES